MDVTIIYCCECERESGVCLVKGNTIYPHRNDLNHLNFYQCKECGNYVGCHRGTNKPLGTIPNTQIRRLRTSIHKLLDPLWRDGKISRGHLYKRMSDVMGKQYHTAEVNSLADARRTLTALQQISDSLGRNNQ